MLNILIKTDSHYKVNRKKIRKTIDNFLKEKKVSGNAEISLNIVGNRMMKSLNKKFRSIDKTTDILSFPAFLDQGEAAFINVPDGMLRLGDIVISYPEARDGAMEENKLVDDKIDELIIHGMQHLLGNHHD